MFASRRGVGADAHAHGFGCPKFAKPASNTTARPRNRIPAQAAQRRRHSHTLIGSGTFSRPARTVVLSSLGSYRSRFVSAIRPRYYSDVKRSSIISGRVAVGVPVLVGLHLVAYRSPETWSMVLYWGSFVGVGLFVGMSSSLAFARGSVTALLGCLGSWAVFTHVLGQVPDEREFSVALAFLLPVTSLLGGAAASFASRAFRGKNRIA